MSDSPDNQSGNQQDGQPQGRQPQGGQPQGGQPQGGQPQGGQPQGGQPQGGQPQGAPPQGGQPQGGYQHGQAPQGQYQTGPGVGDIFSMPETKDQMKFGFISYLIVGIGAGLGMFGLANEFSNASGFGGGIGTVAGLLAVPIAAASLLAVIVGNTQIDALSDQPMNIAAATAAVTSLIGALVTYLVTLLFLMLAFDGLDIGELLLPMILTALGAAVVSGGLVWADRTFINPPVQPAGQQGTPQQPRQ